MAKVKPTLKARILFMRVCGLLGVTLYRDLTFAERIELRDLLQRRHVAQAESHALPCQGRGERLKTGIPGQSTKQVRKTHLQMRNQT